MDKVADGYGLVEAPVWHDQLGLLFSDVLGGGVFRLGLDAEVSQVIPKRRGVGGMALHAEGGLVVGKQPEHGWTRHGRPRAVGARPYLRTVRSSEASDCRVRTRG